MIIKVGYIANFRLNRVISFGSAALILVFHIIVFLPVAFVHLFIVFKVQGVDDFVLTNLKGRGKGPIYEAFDVVET